MDAALLAAQMDRVNAIPFTYEQLDVLKRKLDEVVHDSGSRRPAVSKPSPAPLGVTWALLVSWPAALPTRLPRVCDPAPGLPLPQDEP